MISREALVAIVKNKMRETGLDCSKWADEPLTELAETAVDSVLANVPTPPAEPTP